MSKPTFHVGEEFLGVTTVQFNKEFQAILLTFLGDIIDEDMEPEIIAFKCALKDPARSRIIRERKQQRFGKLIQPGHASGYNTRAKH